MKLKRYRLSKGVTAKEFAEKLGIAVSTLSRYETGAHFPTREMLLKIRAATGGKVKADDFLEVPAKCH